MDEKQKHKLLSEQQMHVRRVRTSLESKLKDLEVQLDYNQKKIINPGSFENVGEKMMFHRIYSFLKAYNIETSTALKQLKDSPYFVRCEVIFKGSQEPVTLYFGKYNYIDEKIFSWIVPTAAIRFQDIGDFTYQVDANTKLEGRLVRRDNFFIINGKILFFSSEASDYEKTLIYQDYLSQQRKSGYVLEDVVDKMEAAQDKVIRANYENSFLITGPAGSGKTTLALHRLAFLLQSPDTKDYFAQENVVVFVQDSSNIRYFGGLLPRLGITGVKITTFYLWAMNLLMLEEYEYVYRYGETEFSKDQYEYEKEKIIHNFHSYELKYTKDFIGSLKKLYKSKLTQYKGFLEQLESKMLDKFDLTLMLLIKQQIYKQPTRPIKVFSKKKVNGRFVEKYDETPLNYALIVVDEVQNYLPSQLGIFKSCIQSQTRAMLYVGDLNQQTQLGTLRNWDEINEKFLPGRIVALEKVYRNTQKILEYIKNVGYDKVQIPDNLPIGSRVEEINTNQDEITNILGELLCPNNQDKDGKSTDANIGTTGIILLNPELKPKVLDFVEHVQKELISQASTTNKEIRKQKYVVGTVDEIQGVEFEKVIFIFDSQVITDLQDQQYDLDLIVEKKRILKDLIYVALTRAMVSLAIVNVRDPLKETLAKI